MEQTELNKHTVLAKQLDTHTIVERENMPGHQLVKTDAPLVDGKLIFHPVIRKGDGWHVQNAKVLIEPEKLMIIVGSL
ncbi:MAG: hypothetical protein HYZ51_01605 [Candidatus Doudnabacteria bacterium]|nr:hypothetical protein [Candidatus Doudnabacteria bacterium]